MLLLTYSPLFYEEVKYTLRNPNTQLTPIDREFGIVIPKLGANAHVIANVNPYDSIAYQRALTRGVAHARGTSVPGAAGRMFLFAHSSDDFYDALRYNSVFYLLPKLTQGDRIDLYYKGSKFTYEVTDKKLVPSSAVTYLEETESPDSSLILMTCWPPGTTMKRLLVFARLTSPR